MAIEVFNRYENKYLMSEVQLNHVLSEIEEHMVPDKFNRDRKTYSISNIYFDTQDDYQIRTSSFDTNIRTRRDDLQLELGTAGALLLPKGVCLMEIKTASVTPLWLSRLLSHKDIYKTSFSKYGYEYKNYVSNFQDRPNIPLQIPLALSRRNHGQAG